MIKYSKRKRSKKYKRYNSLKRKYSLKRKRSKSSLKRIMKGGHKCEIDDCLGVPRKHYKYCDVHNFKYWYVKDFSQNNKIMTTDNIVENQYLIRWNKKKHAYRLDIVLKNNGKLAVYTHVIKVIKPESLSERYIWDNYTIDVLKNIGLHTQEKKTLTSNTLDNLVRKIQFFYNRKLIAVGTHRKCNSDKCLNETENDNYNCGEHKCEMQNCTQNVSSKSDTDIKDVNICDGCFKNSLTCIHPIIDIKTGEIKKKYCGNPKSTYQTDCKKCHNVKCEEDSRHNANLCLDCFDTLTDLYYRV